MLRTHADSAPLTLSIDALPEYVAAMPSGGILSLIGVDGSTFRAVADVAPSVERQMLELDLGGGGTTSHVVGRILDDLAALALVLWPHWYRNAETAQLPDVTARWRQAAGTLAAAGQAPRFRRLAPRVELRQLLAAVAPAGLVLLATLDPARPQAAAARIAALEWCAGAGASIAILFPSRPPDVPPFDRVLYRAIDVTHPAAPVLSRLIVPRGKAHGGSETERRLQEVLLRDPELAPLFAYNRCVSTGTPGFTPRVDLVWDDGRVIVELDGIEHQRDPNFGDDRHRDYELLVAGYLVLRLTNRQIETDLQRAVEKIRNVVRYRRSRRDPA